MDPAFSPQDLQTMNSEPEPEPVTPKALSTRQKKNIRKQARKSREKAASSDEWELGNIFNVLQEYNARYPSDAMRSTLENVEEAEKLVELRKKRLETLRSGTSPIRLEISKLKKPNTAYEEITQKLMKKIQGMEMALVDRDAKIEDMQEAFAIQAHQIIKMDEMRSTVERLEDHGKEMEKCLDDIRKSFHQLSMRNSRLRAHNAKLTEDLEVEKAKNAVEAGSGDAASNKKKNKKQE